MHEKLSPTPNLVPLNLGPREWAGDLDAAGLRFALVVSRFNGSLTAALASAAVERLRARGAAAGDIEIFRVPGAYEIPFVVDRIAANRPFDAIIALGCVIQGETPHAALINSTVAAALSESARRHAVPVIDAVVPTLNVAQAMARCAVGENSRGAYAADAAVEMARLARRLRETAP
jgi:6,7-dimethyl-8-ribityllumazine synthase